MYELILKVNIIMQQVQISINFGEYETYFFFTPGVIWDPTAALAAPRSLLNAASQAYSWNH